MYLKQVFYNAKRFACDYLLYIITLVILTVIMMVCHFAALAGQLHAGFQTHSLPLLIILIAVILAGGMQRFLIKRRAKEFACCLLFGMERKTLSQTLFAELWMIGLLCFVPGVFIASGISCAAFYLFQGINPPFSLLYQSFLKTLGGFCIVELLSAYPVKRMVGRLEIRELMITEKRSRNFDKDPSPKIWGILSLSSLLGLTGSLMGIAFFPAYAASALISVIALPLLSFVFLFYQWLYRFLTQKRRLLWSGFFRQNYLYLVSQFTMSGRTDAVLSGIFTTCLLFSAMAFLFGTVMLQSGLSIWDNTSQKWMGFLQILICIIFLVIYFSFLSLWQIFSIRQKKNDLRTLHFLGKTREQILKLCKTEMKIHFFLPALVAYFLLLIAMPLVNLRLNASLPALPHHILPESIGWFSLCFLVLYLGYYLAICGTVKNLLQNITAPCR